MNIISLVSYTFLPARSGGQKGIALFYKYFSRQHQVAVVTTKNNSAPAAEGYELLNILSNSPMRYVNPFLFFKLRRIIKERKAECLILEHPYYGWLGILLKRFCGVRLVVHSHNIEGKRWRSLGKWWWRILWNYEKLTHRSADYNFFIQDEDKNYAIKAFGLDENKCLTVSFGTEIEAPPAPENRIASRKIICEELRISEQTPLLLFNGAFRYKPNREALENLLYRINPVLQEKKIDYQILIVGLDIPEIIRHTSYPQVIILGFVENLELYLKGCDVFLNPVRSGGGIKTKLVEALAYDLDAVSTMNGAIGIDAALCNSKLILSPDHNWNLFTEAIIRAMKIKTSMSDEFYQQFYWGNITRRAADALLVASEHHHLSTSSK